MITFGLFCGGIVLGWAIGFCHGCDVAQKRITGWRL